MKNKHENYLKFKSPDSSIIITNMNEDKEQDIPLEPVDPTHDDRKFGESCYMSDHPPHVFLSRILACPSISNIDKQRLIERYKKSLFLPIQSEFHGGDERKEELR